MSTFYQAVCGRFQFRMASLFAPLLHMLRVFNERQQLRSMEDYQLRDIGVTRAEANREANRLFWDV